MQVRRFHLASMLIWLMIGSSLSAQAKGSLTRNEGRAGNDFVKVEGKHFVVNQQRYAYVGTNLWYGANLGADDATGHRARLLRELDRLQNLGIKNLRVMAGTEGPDGEPWRMLPAMQPHQGEYNPAVLRGLDFLLNEMAKRSMRAVLCLSNYWHWSGGFAQYLSWNGAGPIPYPPPAEGGDWNRYKGYVEQFYTNYPARAALANHIRYMVTRTNSVSGTPYVSDPTIMAWELANEPDAYANKRAFIDWIAESSRLIKSLDPNHLVISGSEGETAAEVTEMADIDYATTHIWVQNIGWYDPTKPETYKSALKLATSSLKKSQQLIAKIGKPLVLAEFGIARDNGLYAPGTPANYRAHFFNALLGQVYLAAKNNDELAGVNFWAWAGEGRPRIPGQAWAVGDDFTGDPPHEPQGWYSVYDKDRDVQRILRRYARLMGGLN